MATRLLYEWLSAADGDARFTHTAIDDLESFLWILFWVPLEVQHIKFRTKPKPESTWRAILNSHVLKEQIGKGDLVKILKVEMRSGTQLGYIKWFADLIVQWHSIAVDGWVEVKKKLHSDQAQAQLDLDFHKQYYQRYLDVGFKYLGSLPDTWDVKEPSNK